MRKSQKTQRLSSDIKLFLLFLAFCICGLLVLVFRGDIKQYFNAIYEDNSSMGVKSLMREEAVIYGDKEKLSEEIIKININNNDAQDKYKKEDKEYLEKIINNR